MWPITDVESANKNAGDLIVGRPHRTQQEDSCHRLSQTHGHLKSFTTCYKQGIMP